MGKKTGCRMRGKRRGERRRRRGRRRKKYERDFVVSLCLIHTCNVQEIVTPHKETSFWICYY